MKSLLFLLLFLPSAASAQTEKDYQDVMDKFVRYYNKNLTDSICTLFPERTEGQVWNASGAGLNKMEAH